MALGFFFHVLVTDITDLDGGGCRNMTESPYFLAIQEWNSLKVLTLLFLPFSQCAFCIVPLPLLVLRLHTAHNGLFSALPLSFTNFHCCESDLELKKMVLHWPECAAIPLCFADGLSPTSRTRSGGSRCWSGPQEAGGTGPPFSLTEGEGGAGRARRGGPATGAAAPAMARGGSDREGAAALSFVLAAERAGLSPRSSAGIGLRPWGGRSADWPCGEEKGGAISCPRGGVRRCDSSWREEGREGRRGGGEGERARRALPVQVRSDLPRAP